MRYSVRSVPCLALTISLESTDKGWSSVGVAAKLGWSSIAILGAVALAILATERGEPVSAAWIVAAALCTYVLAYRFYSRFIAGRVLRLDSARPTPAVRCDDGLDYV